MGSENRPQLITSVWRLGLSLSGVETQDLRRLIKRCHLALSAIHDPSSPALLEMILPLAVQSPSVLNGLLALSKSGVLRSETDFHRHQTALIELLSELGVAATGPIDPSQAQRALASSLLLSIFAVGSCDQTWSQHVRGMVGIVRSTDRAALASQPTSGFLMGICAFQDISALSIGQRHLSQKAWLSWMIPRPHRSPNSVFSALEVTVGYPESLIDLIAQAAEQADDCAWAQLASSGSSPATSQVDMLPVVSSMPSQELEAAVKRWTAPGLPAPMSSYQQLAIRSFWSALKSSCLLFLWRERGFQANLAEASPRAAESQVLLGEILSDLSVTLDLCKAQNLSIATAMMWPLAVAGAECCHAPSHQRAKVLGLLQGLAEVFSMSQASQLAAVFNQLWERTSQYSSPFISLEQISRDMNLVISLI